MTTELRVGTVGIQLMSVDAKADTLIADVARYLHAEEMERLAGEIVKLGVRVGAAPAVGAGGEQVLATFDNGFTLGQADGEVVLKREGYEARMCTAVGTGTVWVPEAALGPERWVACGVVLESLLILLRRHHLYSIHAAALALRGRGLLVAASADNGKSTLAFRLVQSGWAYLSDDTVLLRPRPSHVEVQGLRSHFSLDAEAEGVFPELAAGREAALLKEEKWAVNVEALYPEQRATTSVPHVLLFPQIVDAATSRLSAVSPAEALRFLLAQSSLARVKLEGAREHFEVLGRLAHTVPAYRLHAGRDILEDPTRAAVLLTPLMEEAVVEPYRKPQAW